MAEVVHFDLSESQKLLRFAQRLNYLWVEDDPNWHEEYDRTIRELDCWLYYVMDEHNLSRYQGESNGNV